MTVKTVVDLTDDLTGSDKGVKTVVFGWEGKTFEIDLNPLNRGNLERSLNKYLKAARPVEAQRKVVKGSKPATDLTPVRVWARENGWTVGDRGRISKDILDAYHVYHA